MLSHVVFADPANAEARALGADALEQLGYAAESGAWRNAYLFGAHELRQGLTSRGGRALPSLATLRAMSLDAIFDYLGVRLDAERAEGRSSAISWVFSDLERRYTTLLSNCALTYLADREGDRADATVTLERETLHQLILGQTSSDQAIRDGLVRVEGDAGRLTELFDLLDDFGSTFEIVEPKPEK